MRNWKLIAEGVNLDIPAADLPKLVQTLEAMDTAFRPLAEAIPDEVEPAVIFHIQPEERA
jgi:hypothetical protein